MRKIWIMGMVCCSFFLSSQSISEQWKKDQKERIGQSMNGFQITSLNKDTISNENLPGKITLFNFWEYHCKPCRIELKPLDELYTRLKEYPDFQFISIASVERKGVSALVEELELSYDVYTVGGAQIKELITWESYPVMIITDRNGNIVYYERGGARTEDGVRKAMSQLEKRLIKLLNE